MCAQRRRNQTSSGLTEQPDAATLPSADQLRQIVQNDRLARAAAGTKMSWTQYAKFLNVPQTTLYKIAMGRSKRPHTTTVAWIMERIRLHPPTKPQAATPVAAEGGAIGGQTIE